MAMSQLPSNLRWVPVAVAVGLCLLASCYEAGEVRTTPISRETACAHTCPNVLCYLEQATCEQLCGTDEDVDGCWVEASGPDGGLPKRTPVDRGCRETDTHFVVSCRNEFPKPGCRPNGFRL